MNMCRLDLGRASFNLDWRSVAKIAGNLVRVDWRNRCSDAGTGLSHCQMRLGWRGILFCFVLFITSCWSRYYSNCFVVCCAFAGKESKYTNASMGQLKMKPWFLASQRTLEFKKKRIISCRQKCGRVERKTAMNSSVQLHLEADSQFHLAGLLARHKSQIITILDSFSLVECTLH